MGIEVFDISPAALPCRVRAVRQTVSRIMSEVCSDMYLVAVGVCWENRKSFVGGYTG